MTNARLIAAFLLIATTPAFSQSSLTRSNVQQALGFEDQTASTLTGWHSYPPGSAAADNSIVHSGRWSVRLQRDAGTAGKFSVLTRSLPVDFTGTAIEFRAYLRLQDVSEFAGLWLCLVPGLDGAYFSERQKEALWDRFFTGAPARQRQCVERYSIVKRA